MTFSHQIIDSILVLHLEGDLLGLQGENTILDYVDTEELEQYLYCAVDITNVNYMNSSGLSLLIRLLTKFRNKNGEVVLVNPSESVRKLLVITKLNAIFSVVAHLDEAPRILLP